MIRKIKIALHAFLAFVLLLGAVLMSAVPTVYADGVSFAGGEGSADHPYLIETPEQFNEVRYHEDQHFKLIADIDLADYLAEGGGGYNYGSGWLPISNFLGVFDGNGHTITGLRINRAYSTSVGLFGAMSAGAEIKNVGLIDVDVTCNHFCGALVGRLLGGEISHSYSTGNVVGAIYVGGLLGVQYDGEISQSYSKGHVEGEAGVGGLVGALTNGSIRDSYSAVNVRGDGYLGGLLGHQVDGEIIHSYAIGSLQDGTRVGGLVGSKDDGDNTASFYDQDTTGQNDVDKGTGLPTSEMQLKSTYVDAGWDFADIWNIDVSGKDQLHHNGYPYLKTIQAYVTYDGNGNTGGESPFDNTSYHPSVTEAVYVAGQGDLVKTGYTFAGWNTSEDGSGTRYDVGDNMPITEDTTLYAQWMVNPYTVTFDPESGDVNPATQTKQYGSSYGKGADGEAVEGLPTPTRTGYTFAGWYDGAGGTGNKVTDVTIVQTASDHTLYAKWTINAYTVSYDGNGSTDGTVPDAVTGDYDTELTMPGNTGNLVKTGYTFAGWNTSEDGSGTRYDVGDNMPITEDTTLYAQWTANPYTVTFDPESGDVNPVTQTKQYGSSYGEGADGEVVEGLPTPTRTGYTFAGWYDGAGGTGNKVTDVTIVQTASDHTLYAKWTINAYTVSYDGNGSTDGTVPDAVTGDYDTELTMPGNTGNLVKTGYTFAGWNTSEDGSGTRYDAGDSMTITADITLYAQWLSSNALLGDVSVTQGDLGFIPSEMNYTLDVPHDVKTVDIYIKKGNPFQRLTVTGAVYHTVTGDVYHYEANNLVVGETLIHIQVQAQDGTQNNYNLTLQRLSNNADLSHLTLSEGILNPSFSVKTTAYTASVSNSVNSLNITANAAESHATMTINGIAVDSGMTSGEIALHVGHNLISIIVTAQDGTTKTYTIDVTRATASSSGEGGEDPSEDTDETDGTDEPNTPDESGEPDKSDNSDDSDNTSDSEEAEEIDETHETDSTDLDVIDLAVTIGDTTVQTIATATTKVQDEGTVLTVSVNTEQLVEQLEQTDHQSTVIIPVTASTDEVSTAFTGTAVKVLENKNATVEIQTPIGIYKLPASEVMIDQLSEQLGAGTDLENVIIHVDIAKSGNTKADLLEESADNGGYTVVVPPVDFTVTAEYADQRVRITKFNSFVEREIPLPDGADSGQITTAVVLEEDGTLRHVPTRIIQRDGTYFAKINSLTNSTYSIIWNPVQFADVEQHWAMDVINDMGSRLVISGTSNGLFSPDREITRAEFAAIMVRGLGLKLEAGSTEFTDVTSSDWYNDVVKTAHGNHLINGYEDGTFRPNERITREQAMVIINYAMAITKLTHQLSLPSIEETLRSYHDMNHLSSWAAQGVANAVEMGIVSGRSSTELAPKAYMTRGEVAVMIERLLRQSGLI